MMGKDVPLSTWPKAQPCLNPCGCTRFSIPAFAANRSFAARAILHQPAQPERCRVARAPSINRWSMSRIVASLVGQRAIGSSLTITARTAPSV
jgi:hypothetical protein